MGEGILFIIIAGILGFFSCGFGGLALICFTQQDDGGRSLWHFGLFPAVVAIISLGGAIFLLVKAHRREKLVKAHRIEKRKK